MAVQIQLRRDTQSNWSSYNPILAEGEFGFEQDTGRIKVGDGSTAWNGLNYIGGYGSIAGDTGQILFNTSNAIDASANLIFNDSTKTLIVNGSIEVTKRAAAIPYNIGTVTDDLTINFNNGNNQYFTYSNTVANKVITLLAPTNTREGMIGTIRIERDVSPKGATFVFSKEWYFEGGTVPDINGTLTFEEEGYIDYYIHTSSKIRASFSGAYANTTNI